ncbi:MAG TPA: type II toxin-antitoxin system RelE/ParE family toxin [Nitrospiria bacterium]|nr:type II toxin-antitoxin system RelE/ParE family toxin [Nitrospiria bacterium]
MPKKLYAVEWTAPALRSLLEVVQYIKADDPEAAQRFGKEIKKKVARLARFPNSGRMVPEFPTSGLREVIIGHYRIIYRVVSKKSRVEILTVHHGAQQIEEG